jgi:Holliday junction resolvasome RuvABC endonuclease subunit
MRSRAIYVALSDLIMRYSPVVAIAAEAMSFPRNASNAAKMALSWGVIAAISEALQLPIVQSSPKEVKRAVASDPGASKEEVMAALIGKYPGQFDRFMATSPKADLEHGFDAAATVIAGLPSEAIQVARRILH